MSKKAKVVLEDGTVYEGRSFGFSGTQTGEIVFNTAMCGYQEVLTDPSYKGQIVVMTYPLIGNYGINSEDYQSRISHVSGFIVKENSSVASNWRSEISLSSYLKKEHVIAIEGVDTRAITRHIRLKGAMKAVISTEQDDISSLSDYLKEAPGLIGQDLVKQVTCSKERDYIKKPTTKDSINWLEYLEGSFPTDTQEINKRYRVVAIDYGIKENILRQLDFVGCDLTIVPAHYSAEEILAKKPQGIFLSNGPGDPAALPYAIETVKNLFGKAPIFGICLGHQILGLALGGRSFKLKFGHRGCNHPVKDIATGRIEITSQNHGFCIDQGSLESDDIIITHINLNDHTVEGFEHKKLPLFSVQYHPEAACGPHDSHYLFKRFYQMIRENDEKVNG